MSQQLEREPGDFPIGPVAKTLHSQCGESGMGLGTRFHVRQLKILDTTTKTSGSQKQNKLQHENA